MEGVPFVRDYSGVRPGKRRSSTGLSHGRVVDNIFSKVIEKKMKLRSSDRMHRRCEKLFKLLKQLEITPFKSKLRVFDETCKVRTELDAVGHTRDKLLWVIELKTTQYPYRDHKELYTQRCKKYPYMSCGLPNTEETHHRLQVQFGMLALSKTYGVPPEKIRGIVLMSCSDKTLFYVVRTHVDRGIFVPRQLVERPPVVKKKKKAGSSRGPCIMSKWPVQAEQLLKQLSVTVLKTGSGIGTGATPTESAIRIAVLSGKLTPEVRERIQKRCRKKKVLVLQIVDRKYVASYL